MRSTTSNKEPLVKSAGVGVQKSAAIVAVVRQCRSPQSHRRGVPLPVVRLQLAG